jgi:hypothetical protein
VVLAETPLGSVPVIVTDEVPVCAEAEAVRLSVEEQVGVHLVVLKDGVTPDGRPFADRDTKYAGGVSRVRVMVVEVKLPCPTVRVGGLAEIVK